MRQTGPAIALALLACNSAQAALQSRLAGQAFYDDVLNITWLADANLAATNTFGVAGIGGVAPGTMTWSTARAWIAAMNASNGGLGFLGVNIWRLPATDQPDPTCATQTSVSGFPLQGSGVGCTGSELGHLRNVDGITSGSMGPFTDVQPSDYWSGTEYAPDNARAWSHGLDAVVASQTVVFKTSNVRFAWAVSTGDIDADGDGIPQTQDNCTLVANPTQLDADGDHYGNICDGDLNNSGLVTATDNTLLRNVLNLAASASPMAAAADMNGSGLVTALDNTLLRNRLNTAPGPSYIDLRYFLAVAKTGSGAGSVSSSPAGITCGADCSENYAPNTLVVVTAVPLTGSLFSGWSGDCAGTATSCLVTMNDAKAVSANFTLQTFALTVATSGSGAGTVSSSPPGINCGADCSETYNYNTVVNLTPIASFGSTFAGWSGSCSGLGACTVTMNGAKSVSATFTLLDTNPVCASNAALGSVSGDTVAAGLSTTGVGEKWFKVRIAENDSDPFSPIDLTARITLTQPPGVDYDLYVYCVSCGGALAGSSTLGTGQTETVNVRRDELLFSPTDDSFDVLIEVRYFFGGSTSQWNLSVAGHTGSGAETCP